MATKRLSDDHIKLMIGEHIKYCQTTMLPVIKDVDKKANAAHCRDDAQDVRLFRLDDERVGQVTVLTKLHEKTTNLMWAVVATVLISMAVNYFAHGKPKISKEELTEAVKAAIKP